MIRSGVPTPCMTRATNECTGAISTATFGTSAIAVLIVKAATANTEPRFVDIGHSHVITLQNYV
jgi:hypothetical protein